MMGELVAVVVLDWTHETSAFASRVVLISLSYK
jgi:hypothetical protein